SPPLVRNFSACLGPSRRRPFRDRHCPQTRPKLVIYSRRQGGTAEGRGTLRTSLAGPHSTRGRRARLRFPAPLSAVRILRCWRLPPFHRRTEKGWASPTRCRGTLRSGRGGQRLRRWRRTWPATRASGGKNPAVRTGEVVGLLCRPE